MGVVPDKNKFLPSQVFYLLDENTKREVKTSSRVTGLFSDELKDYVQKTGLKHKNESGRPEEYYRLIKPIEKFTDQ